MFHNQKFDFDADFENSMFIMFSINAKMNFDFCVSNDNTFAKKNSVEIDFFNDNLTSRLLTSSQKNVQFRNHRFEYLLTLIERLFIVYLSFILSYDLFSST